MQTQHAEVGVFEVLTKTATADDLAARVDQTLSNSRRLAMVRSSDLLDSQSEETFDSLSRLAASLIGVPVSFLSILDGKRDFYKSQCGIPEPLASVRQLSGRTFCHYVVTAEQPLVIEDTHAHPVWQAVPVVESLGVRAYLGIPVIVDGQPIGSFSVADSCPRTWTQSEIEILVQISLAATREIEVRVAMKAAMAEAERANALAKINEQLLAVVIHDLRTPLQVIRMSATLLSSTVSANGKVHLARLMRATDSVKNLVDTLVPGYVEMSASSPCRQSLISSGKLLRDAMEMVADRAGISLVMGSDSAGHVLVDYSQMLRVLGNLIGNCIKYCPVGSSVVLNVRESEESIHLSVTDDGPGMSVSDQLHAFERGWQGQDAIARQDGSGLGLAIVRELVSRNGGVVTLDSQIGRGTKVTVRFPAASG